MTSFIFHLPFCFMSLKIDAAAATMLQLQKYYYSKSIHNKKLNLYTKFSDNQYIAFCIIQFAAFSSFHILTKLKKCSKLYEIKQFTTKSLHFSIFFTSSLIYDWNQIWHFSRNTTSGPVSLHTNSKTSWKTEN